MPVKADTQEKMQWFRLAWNSIFIQDWKGEMQIVVVDDYGNIPEAESMYTRVVTPEHKGLAYALNYGLQFCTGDLIIRMDADDYAKSDLVSKHVAFFNEHPEVKICGVQLSAHHWETWKQLDGCWWPTHHPYVVTPEWAYHEGGFWFCNHPGMAYRRDFINRYAYREGGQMGMEDYCLWIDILKSGELIFNRMDIGVEYRYKEPVGRNEKKFKLALQTEKNKLKP